MPKACHNFGHAKEDCARISATTIAGVTVVPVSEHIMDAEVAEAAAPSIPTDCPTEVKSPSERVVLLEPAGEGSNDHLTKDNAVRPEASTVVAEPAAAGVAAKPVQRASKNSTSRASSRSLPWSPVLLNASQEVMELAEQAAVAGQRNFELDSSSSQPGTGQGQQGTLSHLKRSRIHVTPDIPEDDRRNSTL